VSEAQVGRSAAGRRPVDKPLPTRRRPRIDRREPSRASQSPGASQAASRAPLVAVGGDVTVASEPLWTVRDVSEFLRIPVSTLHQWRYEGRGPDAYRIGKHLRYDPAAVRIWLDRECRGARV